MSLRIWFSMSGLTIAIAAGLPALLAGCSTTRPIETIRASGDHKLEHGDYQGARDEFGEIVSRTPGDWDAHYKYGLALLKLNDPEPARQSLETAYTRKPSQEVADALAEAMYQQGDQDRLFAFLRQRAESTQTIESYLQLARYSTEMGDADSAKTAIDTAIELDAGETVEPYLAAAEHAERLGHLDEAVHRLRQAYGINQNDQRVLAKLRALGETPGPTLALPPGRNVSPPPKN